MLVLAIAFALPAHAQMPRQLPANGKVGQLVGKAQPYPLLQIGDKVFKLAPGGRIFDQENRIIQHSYLPEQAIVVFVEDVNGDVSRVVILRPDEIEQLQRAR